MRENNLCLEFDKIQYCKTKIDFLGDTYTNKGHHPTNDKITAISHMEQPSNMKKLQSSLGMCNFLSKYSTWLVELCDNLWQLTCKDVHYKWGPEHIETFNDIKKVITSPPGLSYYDPNKPYHLQTDACTKDWGHPPTESKACKLCIKGTTILPIKVCSHWIGSTSCQLGCWKNSSLFIWLTKYHWCPSWAKTYLKLHQECSGSWWKQFHKTWMSNTYLAILTL